MAIRKVARLGHPVLREPCRALTPDEIVSAPIRQLIIDMRETMVEYGGVGIAAPQVHESVQLALVDVQMDDAHDSPTQSFTVINPSVTVLDDTRLGHWEGCLSVPDLRGYVERPAKVRVDYLDENAQVCTLEVEGFLATVFQHELDHLDGVVYVDRIEDPTRFSFMREFTRYHM
jgi:peptide deformylase